LYVNPQFKNAHEEAFDSGGRPSTAPRTHRSAARLSSSRGAAQSCLTGMWSSRPGQTSVAPCRHLTRYCVSSQKSDVGVERRRAKTT
jgi:hypothetical protein